MASMHTNDTIRLQFCSDLHLEFPLETKRLGRHLLECMAKVDGQEVDDPTWSSLVEHVVPENENIVPPRGDYLALLGDIVDGQKIRDGTYRNFLLRQCPGYKAVFVIAGNHEFYRAEYGKCRSALASLCKEVSSELGDSPTVHFLDCDSVDIPGTAVRVLGCTLWSHVPQESRSAVSSSLSDYTAIKVAPNSGQTSAATVDDTNQWNAREVDWLRNELQVAEAEGRRCIVLTHHAPSFNRTCPPRHTNSPISSGFCNNLEDLLDKPTIAWLFGHTHWSSWQKAKRQQQTKAIQWETLTGGVEGPLVEADLASEKAVCHLGESILVASNQLGYAAQGSHVSGSGSRCHPLLNLIVTKDGNAAKLAIG
eukprot:TRINITY_DN6100_c0_g2_i1.p1 TRINITY_DN6100_c0_g2~~TRINITY_DN6100_c0_g2_i1.p1  ORF type:complete len:389 (+),score=59.81 TRINITY_DN6100_c0_g2_i1:70-1167(+)